MIGRGLMSASRSKDPKTPSSSSKSGKSPRAKKTTTKKAPEPVAADDATGAARVTISRPDKIMFPAIGLSKGALIEYYERIAPLLLPHLADRPLTLERWPDGLSGDA